MQEHEQRKEHGHSILSLRADREGIGGWDRHQLGSVLMFTGLVFSCLLLVFWVFSKSVISVQRSIEIAAVNRLWVGVDFLNQG